MFLFKKIVSQFFFPLTFSLIICYIGLFLLIFSKSHEPQNKRRKCGLFLITSGLLLLTAFSYEPVANFLLTPLENAYPAFDHAAVESTNPDFDPKYIVVLGGGHSGDSTDNPLIRLSDTSARRLMEGIRLSILYPESKLILSGGIGYGVESNATIMSLAAEALGVSKNKIILEDQSLDTKEEARFVKEIVGTELILLVTTDSHMPRSMALFTNLQMNPIPVPIRKLSLNTPLEPASFFPSESNISKCRRGIYEYLGLLWGRLNGQL